MNVAVYAAFVGTQLLAVGKQVVFDDVKQYCFVAESMVALVGHGMAMVQSWLLHSCCCQSVSGTRILQPYPVTHIDKALSK